MTAAHSDQLAAMAALLSSGIADGDVISGMSVTTTGRDGVITQYGTVSAIPGRVFRTVTDPAGVARLAEVMSEVLVAADAPDDLGAL